MAADERQNGGRQKRRFGKKHLEQFTRNAAGEYEYTGTVHRFEGDGSAWRGHLRRMWCYAGSGAVLALAAGMLPYATERAQFHVFLPYIGAFIAHIVLVWKLGRITNREGVLRSYIVEETIPYFRPCAFTALILHLVQIAAIAVDLVQKKVRTSGPHVAVLMVLLALSALCMFAAAREGKKSAFYLT